MMSLVCGWRPDARLGAPGRFFVAAHRTRGRRHAQAAMAALSGKPKTQAHKTPTMTPITASATANHGDGFPPDPHGLPPPDGGHK
jgi:hypothetical protein